MKKFLLTAFLLTAFASGAYAFEEVTVEDNSTAVPAQEQPSQLQTKAEEPSFDWEGLSVEQRNQKVDTYKNIVFGEDSKINLSKDEFHKRFAKYKNDRNFKHHYMLTNNGVTEDEDAKYNPFYYKKDTLVIYAIQYKNDIHDSLYYTAYGKLYYVDITSENYPNFPYYSMQYDKKGNLRSAIYFVSKDIQYMYNPQKEFVGIWYKDKMYDINSKQISTRKVW